MKLGAEPKKLVLLGVLLAGVVAALYMNVFSGDSSSSSTPAPRAVIPVAATVSERAVPDRAPAPPDTRRTRKKEIGSGEIKFRVGAERPEDRPDPATIDPTLRLDLLAKVQSVEPQAAMRNLFQYGAAAPPPSATPVKLPDHPPTIKIGRGPAPPSQPPPPPGPPPPPKAPTITMKYYGYRISKVDGRKEAFLLDGDDIIFAEENDAVKRGRYKVVAIGLTSITIEDTQFKSNQILRILDDAPA